MLTYIHIQPSKKCKDGYKQIYIFYTPHLATYILKKRIHANY